MDTRLGLYFVLLSAIVLNLAWPSFSLLNVGLGNGILAYADSIGIIEKTKSGLVASDSLAHSHINTDYWFLYGDAVNQGATYDSSEDSDGMHIGVKAASSGQWGGFYAESPNSSAHLYHVILTVPFRTTIENWW